MLRQRSGDFVPRKRLAHPDMKRRRNGVGVVEAHGHDVEFAGGVAAAVGQGRAALATEAAGDAGRRRVVDRRAVREAETGGRDADKGQPGRRGDAAAGLTMTDAAAERRSFDRIANGPA
jgi:hypothetical protein